MKLYKKKNDLNIELLFLTEMHTFPCKGDSLQTDSNMFVNSFS